MAKGATNFAGKLVGDGFGGWIVPLEIVVAFGEINVGFMENRGPLKGCGYREESAYLLHQSSNGGQQWHDIDWCT